jgi:RHS repeat-associated protein
MFITPISKAAGAFIGLGVLLLALSAGAQPTRHQCTNFNASFLTSNSVTIASSFNCSGTNNQRQIVDSASQIPGCLGCRYLLQVNFGGTVERARKYPNTASLNNAWYDRFILRFREDGQSSEYFNYYGGAIGSAESGVNCLGTSTNFTITDYVLGTDWLGIRYDTGDGSNHIAFSAQINSATVLAVYDEHGNIIFDDDNPPADGKSKVHPRLTNPWVYPTNVLQWSILGGTNVEQTLGCSINSTNGEITVGEVAGKIIVRAFNSQNPTCLIEAELKIGCGSCEAGGCLFGSDLQVSSVEVNITAGKAGFGDLAGVFRIKENYPSAILSTPQALKFYNGSVSTNLVKVLKPGDYVRQVFAPQTLANVVTNSALEYKIEFYAPGTYGTSLDTNTGLYPITGSPTTVWKIKNPNGASYEQLSVTEVSGSRTNAFDYTWDGALNGWELIDDNGQRKQKRYSSTNGVIRTETYLVRNASNVVKYQEVKKFQIFAWGEDLIEKVIGTGSLALTNVYSFYTNSADVANYSRLFRSVEPGGKWTQYTYNTNGQPTSVISQFMDSPIPATTAAAWTNRVTTNIYESSAIQTYTYLNNIETSWNRQVFYSDGSWDVWRTQTRGVHTSSASVIESRWLYITEPFVGLPEKTKHEDGTWTLYSYANSTNGSLRTNTIDHGQGNSPSFPSSITNGLRTVTVLNQAGEILSEKTYDLASTAAYLVSSAITSTNDAFGRPIVVQYLDGTTESYNYDCCGLESFTDREGVSTSYDYDGLKRRYYSERTGIGTRDEYDAAGRVVQSVRIGRDSSEIILGSATFDDAGRRLTSTAPANGSGLNRTTTYAESRDGNNRLLRTTTFPDGGTAIETFFQDGSLLSVTGTAVYPRKYEYGIDSTNAFTKEIRLGSSNEETEWMKNYVDVLGRSYLSVEADGAINQASFDTLGRILRTVNSDGGAAHYYYNGRSQTSYVGVDATGDGDALLLSSLDRFTLNVQDVISNANGVVLRNQTFVWATNNNGTSMLSRSVESTADGLKTWNINLGLTNETRIVYSGNGNKVVSNLAPDGSYTVTQFSNGFPASLTRYAPGNAVLTSESYIYDAHGRRKYVTDARNGTTTFLYNDSDNVYSVTTPQPGSGLNTQTTTLDFDWRDRVWRENFADGTHRTNEFYYTGQLRTTYGAREYPVQFTYDSQGRRKTLTTWQNVASSNGVAVTTWNYDSQRGWLTSVRDNSNQGETYTRMPSGKLRTVTNARGVTSTNTYSAAGDLTSVVFSDANTAKLDFVYNRLGDPITITQTLAGQFTNTTALTYSTLERVLKEGSTSGILNSLGVTNTYDSLLRRSSVAVDGYSASLTRFAYGDASRLLTVSNGVNSAGYQYVQNSDLVQTLTFKNGGTTRATTTRVYDNLNRTKQVYSLNASATTLNSFTYAYNDANQRTSMTLADNSLWNYAYDPLGQLTSAKHSWPDSNNGGVGNTFVSGQQFEFAFDDIGNRKTNKWGGTEFGTGLRTSTYGANALNQYTNRTVPGSVDVLGDAHADALVTVNFKDTERRGDYFWRDVPVNNSSAPAYAAITNIAVLRNGTNADIVTTNIGSVLLAKASETFTTDADGNLTSNSLWTNTWNALNQLTVTESQTTVPSAARQQLKFAYDYAGRRIRKIVSTWNGSNYVAQSTNKFVYDGTRLIARLDGTNGLLQSFTWSGDLPVSIVDYQTGTAGTYFYSFDGNRNIVALISAADGSKAAEYTYGPFGNIIGMTGLMAYANPHRFSSEFYDDETDLICYLFRYYDAATGRWLNRDPIRERGGINLYGFLGNAAVNVFDLLGLAKYVENPDPVPNIDKSTVTRDGNLLRTATDSEVFVINRLVRLPFVGNRTPVADHLLGHFMEGTGNGLLLSESEADAVEASVAVSRIPGFDAAVARMHVGERTVIKPAWVPAGAKTRGTLGRFYARVGGEICKTANGWTFKGEVFYDDLYDFATPGGVPEAIDLPAKPITPFPLRRSTAASAKVEFGENYIPGVPYRVRSPVLNVSAKYGDEFLTIHAKTGFWRGGWNGDVQALTD